MGVFDWLLGKKSKDDGEALIAAAREGHTETVETLLTEGARVNAKSEDGMTALMLAAAFGHTEIVEMLLTKGARVNAKSEYGMTVLMLAANDGHTEIVEMLLTKGARVNAEREDGMTALILAVREEHTKIVEMLLTKGADVNAKTVDRTLLDNLGARMTDAAMRGDLGTLEILRTQHADAKAKKVGGMTALMLARGAKYTEIVRLLKQAGAKE